MEWEPTNEEDERADAARQIEPGADGQAKLQTPLDAPKLAPESDTELELAPNGPAGQGTGNVGNRPVHLRRKRSPQKMNSTTSIGNP